MKHAGPDAEAPLIDYNGGMKSRWNNWIVEMAHEALFAMRPHSDSGNLKACIHIQSLLF